MAIYDCDKFSSLCNEKDVELKAALSEKRSIEMWLPKLSSQGSKKTISKELVDANNQVFEKIHEDLKARFMLRTVEETKKRHLSEKSSLQAKIVELEKNKSSEFMSTTSLILQNCNELKELLDIGASDCDNNMDSMDRVKALQELDGHKIKKYNVWKVHLSEEKEERAHLCK
ncbi:uncharacterized protein LOC125842759 [Solanum stenotomum]|uniref:uncharacterized protein LOC125842759 n=1 Tax=Solanum stenotomum TaxID=172797 RepID=UPI0020D078D2|nr:uncharacterized protein LOC125842759 [Solanum stenotomum]